MSTSPTVPLSEAKAGADAPASRAGAAPLLVCLPSMSSDALLHSIEGLRSAFPEEQLLVASPDWAEEEPDTTGGNLRRIAYPGGRHGNEWVLSAADFQAAARVQGENASAGVLLLGAEAATLEPEALQSMREVLASGVDLVIPRYANEPEGGLVNTSLLYPLTRALYGSDVHFPLPLDAGLSGRMLNRLSASTARLGGQLDDVLLWPVAEASIAGFSIRQCPGGNRVLPHPQQTDLNVLFPAVTASLFTDLENRAAYWQRARALPASRPSVRPINAPGSASDDVRGLVDNFRLAFTNLREIWPLVLPPQSLLQIKKLTATPAESFAFPPGLWARCIYDFAVAFHLRTLNRGHLLGALTPLYLAWVASLLRQTNEDGAAMESLQELTAQAFEQEKPYFVSRWRWPDRFNP